MSLMSPSISVTRYKVNGKPDNPVVEKVYAALVRNTIKEIDDEHPEKNVGWTLFQNPYIPDFEGASFVFGPYLVFSMRIDKKLMPSGIIKKHHSIEMARQLEKNGRNFLTRNEKMSIKEHVIKLLARRIPATPNVYDLVWNVEESWLWFFSNLKVSNEALETLFLKSFNFSLIHLFPYTSADLMSDLSASDRDRLLKLTPTKFAE